MLLLKDELLLLFKQVVRYDFIELEKKNCYVYKFNYIVKLFFNDIITNHFSMYYEFTPNSLTSCKRYVHKNYDCNRNINRSI